MTGYSGGQIQTPSNFSSNLELKKSLVHYRYGFDSYDLWFTDLIFRDAAHHYSYDAHCGCGLLEGIFSDH